MRRTAWLALLSFLLATLIAQPRRPAAAKPKRRAPSAAAAAQGAPEDLVADRWLRSLNLRQRIAQLIVIRTHGSVANPRRKEWRDIQRWVRDSQVGGIIVVNRVRRGAVVKAEPFETLHFINRLQRMAAIPLLVGGDFERSVSMRYNGTVAYPHAMAYAASGKPALTRELGAITAREARALGYQWVFAPSADVNSNPDNPIIGIRAFGTDPETASAHVRAFIEGAHSAAPRVLVSAKHFPGHGDTAVDTHIGMPILESDRARLNSIELKPFRAAIEAGADSVMTAHIALPQVDTARVPSTISPVVIGDVLRKDLGFTGIVTTDAMDMEALAKEYGSAESSVRALEAGVDVLLMPRDPDQAINAVVKAVAAKRLTAARIDASVRKVLRAKARLGLQTAKLANPDGIDEVLSDEDSAAHAQAVADAAVALVRGPLEKLPNEATSCVVALLERRGNGQGEQLLADLRARAANVRTILLDPLTPTFQGVTDGCEKIAVAAYLGFGGTGKLHELHVKFLDGLLSNGKRVTLAAVGNPFLLRAYPQAAAWLATYSNVPASEAALVKALVGPLTPQGRVLLAQ